MRKEKQEYGGCCFNTDGKEAVVTQPVSLSLEQFAGLLPEYVPKTPAIVVPLLISAANPDELDALLDSASILIAQRLC